MIPVYGVIAHRAAMVQDVCGPGGTSTEMLDAAIRRAAADPTVRSIVLDIDSPGGNVAGVQEIAATIFAMRAEKPIAAVANAAACSAAYWIGTAAHELYVTPSGEVGSIGVYGVHTDTSRADEAMGRTTTVISAGKYKTEDLGPLSTDAKAHLQSRIDSYYSQFVRDVARHRAVSVEKVRDGYGQGRTLGAAAALEAGMVDGVMTLSQVIGKYARRTVETANRHAAGNALQSIGLPRARDGGGSLYEAKVRIAAAALPPSPKLD